MAPSSSGTSALTSALDQVERASPLNISGVVPCTAGTVKRSTPLLTMVWQLPMAGGPFAIQPPDIQIVEAAVMASSGP